MLVHSRGIRGASGFDRRDRVEILVFDQGLLFEIFCGGAGISDAHHHRFAYEPDLTAGERRIGRGLETAEGRLGMNGFDAGQIGGAEDPVFRTGRAFDRTDGALTPVMRMPIELSRADDKHSALRASRQANADKSDQR